MGRCPRPICAPAVLLAWALLPSEASARPFFFEPNVGQAPAPLSFVARGQDYSIGVSATEAAFLMRGGAVRLRFVNAASGRQVEGLDRLPGVSSYFRGRDPARWRTGIAQFSRVRVTGTYPGIDVLYYGRDGALEYDLIVGPGADPSVIALTFEGADSVRLTADGDVIVRATGVELRQRRPVIYQDGPNGRRLVAGRYTIDRSRRVRFQIDDYDKTRALVIDPVVLYAGYLGGPRFETSRGHAVDVMGSLYVTGFTMPLSQCCSEADVFVAKFDATGSRLLYAVTFGGSDHDEPAGIAVDGFGAVYVAGVTSSPDFPIRNAVQPDFHHEPPVPMDGFFAKLDATGTAFVYSSYLGGSFHDEIRALTVTRSGQLIVAGSTSSEDFPVVNAIQPALSGPADAFVAIVNSTGSALERSTYFGGSSTEWVETVVWDDEGGLVITGHTFSASSFPLRNPFQATADDSITLFVARFTVGYDLVYSTLLGGNNDDASLGADIGPSGVAVVAGYTRSSDFPLLAPLQSLRRGESDAIVTKFDADGRVVFSTLLGGGSTDFAFDVAMDAGGKVFVTGQTGSIDFPVVNPVEPAWTEPIGVDGFITQLDAQGTTIEFSTHLGGTQFAGFPHVVLDNAGGLYLSGGAQNADFPVTPFAAQQTFGGLVDVVVAKLGPECATDVTPNVAAGAVLSLPIPLTPWTIELLLVRNQSSQPIGSPITVVLSGLQDAILVGALGTTDCTGAPGSPFLVVYPGPEGFLEPDEITGAWLLLYQTGSVRPTYRTMVLSGVPGR